MLNVHLNGDIVRCPDTAAIKERLKEIRERHRICIYNVKECDCPAWREYILKQTDVKRFSDYGRCFFCSGDKCPKWREYREHGRKEKTFQIDGKKYRQMASAAHYMIKESKHKTIFITLTFPPFKRKYNEKQINECFSRFVNNLHENYNVKYYIGVRENCPTSGRPHFHLLLSIPFTDFTILNNAWCSAISPVSEYAINALQTEKRGNIILYNPRRAVKYCCKYFSKTRGTKSKGRLVFFANDLLSSKVKQDFKVNGNNYSFKKRVSNIKKTIKTLTVNEILQGYKGIYINQTSDYTTNYLIKDSKEFDRFCDTWLYALFELSENNQKFTGVPGSFN